MNILWQTNTKWRLIMTRQKKNAPGIFLNSGSSLTEVCLFYREELGKRRQIFFDWIQANIIPEMFLWPWERMDETLTVCIDEPSQRLRFRTLLCFGLMGACPITRTPQNLLPISSPSAETYQVSIVCPCDTQHSFFSSSSSPRCLSIRGKNHNYCFSSFVLLKDIQFCLL